MKCLRPTYLGDFNLKGRDLRLKGQNRIGNLVVENRNYCEFEDWLNVSLFLGSSVYICRLAWSISVGCKSPIRWVQPTAGSLPLLQEVEPDEHGFACFVAALPDGICFISRLN